MEQVNQNQRPEPIRGRTRRCVVSVFMLTLAGLGVAGMCGECGVPWILSVPIYLAYVIVSAGLIAMIAGRLFQQHGVTRFKFDFAAMLMVVALLAIPMGVGNGLVELIQSYSGAEAISRPSQFKVLLACAFYVLILPVFIVTEAVLHFIVGRSKIGNGNPS